MTPLCRLNTRQSWDGRKKRCFFFINIFEVTKKPRVAFLGLTLEDVSEFYLSGLHRSSKSYLRMSSYEDVRERQATPPTSKALESRFAIALVYCFVEMCLIISAEITSKKASNRFLVDK